MRISARKRQDNLSTRKKVKWALYDRGHFKDIMDRVGDKTKKLLNLFPAAQPLESALIDKEVLELSERLKIAERFCQRA